jgi:type III secretory pathway component EscT
MPVDFASAVARALGESAVEVRSLGLAWARAAPTVALVPAFGLRAVPAPVRIALGLALAAAVAPALGPVTSTGRPWAVELVLQTARGLPVALSAAIVLWAAGMAGDLVDNLRGARQSCGLPTAEPDATHTGALFGLLAALAFLESGGHVRVARALARPELDFYEPMQRVAQNLAASVELAVAIAAPLVAAALVIEVASALVARAAHPAYMQPVLAPLRSVALLAVLAVVLERIVGLFALYTASRP